VALGHRRIGIISGPNRFINTQRKLEGYRAAMRREVGLTDPEIDDLVSLTLFGVEGGEVAAERLLAKGVTGIICASDMMALGAIRAARRRGLRVPEEVSVIGFDDSALIPFTDPPLTTLRQPVASMAVAAVRSLVDEINGHGAPHSEYLFHPELVVRNSTAIAPMRSGVPVATTVA
jgi:DNA-binding LacI/PurR family transcriptional regulator